MRVNKLIASAVIATLIALGAWNLKETVDLKTTVAAAVQELHDHIAHAREWAGN